MEPGNSATSRIDDILHNHKVYRQVMARDGSRLQPKRE